MALGGVGSLAGGWLLAASAQTAGPPVPDAPLTPRIVRDCRKERAEGDIVVCGQLDQPRSPYRLPFDPGRFDPSGEMRSVSRERHELIDPTGGGSGGIGSCSTVGPGGYTGCDTLNTNRAWQQNADGNIRSGPQRP